MRKSLLLSLVLAIAVIGPAAAQRADRGSIRTETMSRVAGEGADQNLIWNIVGLVGLLGLLGLGTAHPDDSYHPSSLE
jgi:hypothetical protein